MICIKCGAQNPNDARYCNNCNAMLPKMADSYEEEAPPIHDRYNQLKNAGEKVKSGEWTADEFIEFVEGIYHVLTGISQDIREIDIPPESTSEFEEELAIGFEGISLYEQGIQEMLGFIQTKDPVHIDSGLAMIRQGNDRINQAMHINRQNRKKLEEMYIEGTTLL